MGDWVPVIVAVVMSAGTIVGVVLTVRKKAGEDYVTQLERRLGLVEDEAKDTRERLARCELAREELASENLRLMKKILSNGGKI